MKKQTVKCIAITFAITAACLLSSCHSDDEVPSNVAAKVVGTEGGELKGTDGALMLSVPAGAIPSDTKLGIELTEETAAKGVGKIYTLTPEGTEFAKPVAITLEYTKEDGKNISPSRMAIAFKNTDGNWEIMPTLKSDTVLHTITTETSHFSQWSLVDVLPVITSFEPLTAGDDEATTIIIEGVNFSPVPAENLVKLNDVILTVSSSSATSLVALLPPGASSGPLKVIVNAQEVLSEKNFTVIPVLPTISGFNPLSSDAGIATTVTISGTHFSNVVAENKITINDVAAAAVAVINDTQLIASFTGNITTGPIKVTVNGKTAVSAESFTVNELVPAITSFTPNTTEEGTVTTVTIIGTNFSAITSENIVSLNDVAATVLSATMNQLVVVIPGSVVTGKLKVVVHGHEVLSPDDFTVTEKTPLIIGFNPETGQEGVTNTVTISGANFSSVVSQNKVSINGVSATVLSATTSTLLVVIPGTVTTGPIDVTVNGKTISSQKDYNVISSSPTITGFTPTTGEEGINYTVVITGTNFSTTISENAVSINGVALTVASASSTALTVIVPPTVTSGLIKIVVNGKTILSDNLFTVVASTSPQITSFTPESGDSKFSTTVSISGLNFSATVSDNQVKLNETVLTVISSSPTSLVVLVPAGASTGRLQVTVNGKTGLSSTSFTVN